MRKNIVIISLLLLFLASAQLINAQTAKYQDKISGIFEVYDPEGEAEIPADSAYYKYKRNHLNVNTIKYIKFNYDNKIFEWIVPLHKDEFSFKENAVLLITDENEKTQKIKVRGEGAQGTYVNANDKFFFEDVNFDGEKDLLVSAGSFGNQGALRYYCFLKISKNKYMEIPEYTNILNPVIDKKNKIITSEWRNSADSYGSQKYKFYGIKLVKI